MKIADIIKRKKRKVENNVFKNHADTQYHALTPESDIQNGQEYMAALDWALEQEDIRNIAISGPYGSGKSSVINTYFKTRENNTVLPISLAAFNLEKMFNDENDNIEDELELGILKQLFYRVKADKISQSRYRKLQPENRRKTYFVSTITEFLLLVLAYFVVPNQVKMFVTSILNLHWCLTILSFAAILSAIWYACLRAVMWLKRNGSLQEIKILDKAILKNGGHEDKESVFNKNMDEIVYFFEETEYRIVVIEDLDRFESTNIFVALRELNNLLNHYEGIKEKITFIYAIKDDMFEEAGERTKFFDFIIPIVPYISSSNSGEILRGLLWFDDEKDKSSLYDISGKFVSLISPYISDMRVLTCICNEFVVFKNTLQGNQQLNLNDIQMLSLIVFKNLCPKDFAQLEDETDDSLVRRAFLDRKKFVSKGKELLAKKREEQEERIREVEMEVLSSIRDVKIALLACLTNYNAQITSISCGNDRLKYEVILRDEFDIDELKNQRLTVNVVYSNNGSGQLRIDDIEKSIIDNGGDYFTRLERLKKGLDQCKEDAKREIEEYEHHLTLLRSYSIQQIIEEFGTDFLSDEVKENDLLVFLLRNGFVDENYADYINYFHPKSISKDEMNFILAVRNHRAEMDYTYHLMNVSQIFDRLQDYEFQQKEVLNFDLADYVLEEKMGSSAEKYFIGQLSNHSRVSMSFIKAYIERGINIDRLIMLLSHKNTKLWADICNDVGISLETRFEYLSYILLYANIEDITAMDREDKTLSEFFLSHPDVLERVKWVPNEKQIQVIDALKLVFTNLETGNLDETIREHVFGNCCYDLNETMLERLVEWKRPEFVEELKKKNYTLICDLDFKPLINYIHDNFNEYISTMILNVESNTEESIDAVEDIIERLCPENVELAQSVLTKEKTVWEDIKKCCILSSESDETHEREYKYAIWKYLFENNRVGIMWGNIEAYFDDYGADETWIAFVVRNIDDLILAPDMSEVPSEIRETLLFENLPEEVFRKFVTKVYREAYEDALSKIDSTKIKVLIEEDLLPFRSDYWDELSVKAPNLRVLYATKNKTEFIDSLNKITLRVNEIRQILSENVFNNQEKEVVLNKLKPAEMTLEIARIIRRVTMSVPKPYVESAWNLLLDDEKYELLLNHLDVYRNEELPGLFEQLSPEYHQFVDRSRRKYTIAYTDYNLNLLRKLKVRDYITSMDEKWIVKKDRVLFSSENEHVLTGYVKQAG